MKNGRDEKWEDPKVTPISAARKKAEQARKAAAAGNARRTPGRGVGELLVGALLVAMAVGLIVSLTRPLWLPAVAVGS